MGDMKSGKAPGIYCITADLLRVDTDTTVNVLHELFNKIWEEEGVPKDWSRGLVKLPKKGDLTSCENWRGTTLMLNISIVAKVLGRVLMNFSLYLSFVDSGEARLDSIHRDTLWKIIHEVSIVPTKIVRMVQVTYTNCTSAVVDGDGRTDWFEMRSSVKQGRQHVRVPVSLGD